MKINHSILPLFTGFILFLSLAAFGPVNGQDVNDAVVEKQIREYTLTPAGEVEYRQYKKVKLLTYNSIHRMYGETFILYNSKYQQLKVLSATTTMKDGLIVKSPDNAFNIVLPRFAANAPAYNEMKEMVVTHTGLEIGATIELDYKLTSSAGFLPGLLATEVLTELSPVREMEVIVRIPLDKVLSYKLLNLKSEPLTQTEGQYRVYRWRIKDLPLSIAEANQPEGAAFQPTLLLSSLTGHDALGDWINRQAIGKQEPAGDLIAMLGDMRKEEKDDLSLALKLQDKIVNEMVYCGVPFNMPGYRGRSPQEVWQSGYGTAFEKANLLNMMLKAVKIQSEIVAVVPSVYPKDVVSPGLWEDFAVRVKLKKGEQIYLSVRELNAQNLLLTAVGKKFLPIPGMNEFVSYDGDNLVNLARLEISGSIKGNYTLEADFEVEMEGGCVPFLEMKRSSVKASSFVGGMGRNVLKEGKIEKSGAAHFEAETSIDKEFALKAEGEYLFLNLPFPERGINAWHLGELPEARKQPFDIPFPIREEFSLSLELPAGLQLLSPTVDKQISNEAGSMNISLAVSGDKLVLKKYILLNKNTFGPNYYKGLRELLNNWNAKGNKELVFKAK